MQATWSLVIAGLDLTLSAEHQRGPAPGAACQRHPRARNEVWDIGEESTNACELCAAEGVRATVGPSPADGLARRADSRIA